MELFNEQGWAKEEIDERLQVLWNMSKLDGRSEAMNLFEEGRHLVSCDSLPWGDEVRERVVQAYLQFIHGEMWATGDGAREMQGEITSMIGGLLGAANAEGRITTGGTESILSAMACAKHRAYTRRFPGIEPGQRFSRPGAPVEPNKPFLEFERQSKSVVMPIHQHYSAFKACALFGLEPVTVSPRTERVWEIDPDDVRAAIREDTVAIFATAGVWPYGTIDPIREMGRIAEEFDLYFHVDACFGGFVIPFLELAGYYDPPLDPWDFRVSAVSSISADLHKNAMVPPPCSLILFRDESLLEMAKVISPPSGVMTGTRATGPVAAAWTMMRALGLEGFKQMSLFTIGLRDGMMAGCQGIEGIEVSDASKMNLFAVYSRTIDLRPAIKALRAKGWTVSTKPTPPPVCLTLVTMPQNAGQVEAFVSDFEEAIRENHVSLGSAPADYDYSHYGGIPL
jgi:glutamate/tyrosine decarboxylase-like PLP-dependent enzyme